MHRTDLGNKYNVRETILHLLIHRQAERIGQTCRDKSIAKHLNMAQNILCNTNLPSTFGAPHKSRDYDYYYKQHLSVC